MFTIFAIYDASVIAPLRHRHRATGSINPNIDDTMVRYSELCNHIWIPYISSFEFYMLLRLNSYNFTIEIHVPCLLLWVLKHNKYVEIKQISKEVFKQNNISTVIC